MGTLISSDENFIIFSYNSLTGTLLRAKKCIILISFSTYNQVALFFSRFVGPSIFQMHLWFLDLLGYLLRLYDPDLSCRVNFLPGLSLKTTALCNHTPHFHQVLHLTVIKHLTNFAKVTRLIKIVTQPSIIFFISSFIQ